MGGKEVSRTEKQVKEVVKVICFLSFIKYLIFILFLKSHQILRERSGNFIFD